jgi:transcriptional regulator with PAS, ATPase and Fis domain
MDTEVEMVKQGSSATVDRQLDRFLSGVGAAEAFSTLGALLPAAAVFVVDADRTIVHWSPGAERLLGDRPDQAVGRMCLTAIRCRECLLGCGIAERGAVTGFPLELYRTDRRIVPVRKYAKGYFDADGQFAGGIEVLVPTGDPGSEDHEIDDGPGIDEEEIFQGLVSRDPTMKRVFQTIRHVAETDAIVLIRGESGTGKELVARALHARSHRADGPFVAANCAALTPSLVESELFGHVKGAFTGAVADRRGLFQQAHRGTLFLDEVAELPLEVQGKLLRVLEERVVTPVGSDRNVAVDVRVVAATHRSLREEVQRGRFREDLMYRLRVVPIFLPALRERRGDIELLLRRFLDDFNRRGPRRVKSVAPEAMRTLLDHAWPGNVRELRNVVEYAFAVGRSPEIGLDELPPDFREPLAGRGASRRRSVHRSEDEKARIARALDRSRGDLDDAAMQLGISRTTLWRRRKKFGL